MDVSSGPAGCQRELQLVGLLLRHRAAVDLRHPLHDPGGHGPVHAWLLHANYLRAVLGGPPVLHPPLADHPVRRGYDHDHSHALPDDRPQRSRPVAGPPDRLLVARVAGAAARIAGPGLAAAAAERVSKLRAAADAGSL